MNHTLRQFSYPPRKDVFGLFGESVTSFVTYFVTRSRRYFSEIYGGQVLHHGIAAKRTIVRHSESEGRRISTMNRARSPNAPKDGSILIIILWAIIILSTLSLALGNFIFAQIKFTNFFIRSTSAVPLAKAACYSAFYERKEDNTKEYDSEKELLAERSQNFQGGVSYKYFFEDEGSRININTVSRDILEKLPGLDEDLADAIVNSNRRPFKIKEEILVVEGITKENFAQFKEFVTVCGNSRVNINTASKEALFALGLENDLIEIITRYRKESPGEDGNAGTDDDGVFLNTSAVLSELRSFEMLSLRQEQQLLSAMSYLTVKSEYLRVNITVKMAGMGKTGSNFSIVIKPDPVNDRIISWAE